MTEDDGIQYLRTVTRPALPAHPFQAMVTGLSLHIDKAGNEPSHTLTFRKSDAPVVHIGRRPGSGDENNTPGRGFLACPVVSRKHAKLVFSDGGHVYLFDTDSHHGTYLAQRESLVPKRLKPESATELVDGDVITFGKSVGADKGLVPPVVARVEMLYGSQQCPLKPLVVPDGAAEGQTSSPLRPSSGRYGVYARTSSEASSSSDEAPSPDSHDSDVEEIPVPAPWQQESNELTRSCWKGLFSFPVSQEPIGFDAYSNDVFEEEDDDNSENSRFSRSTSPMELSSSPEPDPPAVETNASSMAVGEPVVVGAWPRSRSPSIFSSSFPPVRIVAPVDKCVAATPIVNEPQSMDEPDEVWPAPVVDSVVEKEKADKPAESSETLQLNASLATLKTEVAKLQAHRRKYKQRFNDNVHAMGDKFSDLEERTTEAHDLYNLLSERLDDNVDTCQQAQTQLDALQGRMDLAAEIDETPPYVEEGKANAKALADLVAEMTALRDNARKEMAEELESLRQAKEELKSLTEEFKVQQTAASLKRKRSEEEAEEEAETQRKAVVTAAPPRKRARVAKVIAQTATAVVVGAAVTWSALAFS
ncbi:hypothetical protein FB45DRAFT_925700 [Roridomyces roridus]|uniref:FHA domain-containing protein n=1 Tax=Roridomyces roridus TaxID=1738132 RepID=A0AAD7FJC8_9AGAR|nr:hypothetical protein FB45DRAFT_925700 [Roridomyces roridus]